MWPFKSTPPAPPAPPRTPTFAEEVHAATIAARTAAAAEKARIARERFERAMQFTDPVLRYEALYVLDNEVNPHLFPSLHT
jgi:hypothetical protein